jgi:hypothetical protein
MSGPRAGLVALLIAVLAAGCGMQVPSDFTFIRDEAGVFNDAEQAQAEAQLRAIAERSGIYGVVLTARDFPDDSSVVSPVVDEVLARGGEALVALCSPGDCDLSMARGASAGMLEVATQVAPAPEPAPEGNLPDPPGSLREWVEFVGAVSTLEP